MNLVFQLNLSSPDSTRFNLDNTITSLTGLTPEDLGNDVAPFTRMAYDNKNNVAYMVFDNKLWKGRLAGSNHSNLLWNNKPLAEEAEVITEIPADGSFGSMDTCGCNVALAHWFLNERKVTLYDVDTDTINITLIDDSEDFEPFYSCCGFDDCENLYIEFTSEMFDEIQFWRLNKNGDLTLLTSPADEAALSFSWADGKIWRLNTDGSLYYYTPETDTWTITTANFVNAQSLHTISDNELIAVRTGNVTSSDNKIYSYNIDTDTVSTPYLTTTAQANGGGASFAYVENIGAIGLNEQELTLCICVKLTRQDTVVMGFTTHDREVIVDGVTYSPVDSIQSTAVRHELGTGIANLDIEGLIKETVLSSESITETELRAGIYDSARVEMFIVDWLNPTKDVEVIITGTTGEVEIRERQYKTEVRGLMQKMSQQIGELTSPLCRVKRLGDERCKIDIEDYTFTSTVVSITSLRLITFTDAHATGYFDYGIVRFTSGLNAGIEKEIKSSVLVSGDNEITLQEAFPYEIEPGDIAELEAGCDRKITTCSVKFDNVVNFRGEPYCPGTDQLIKVGRMS